MVLPERKQRLSALELNFGLKKLKMAKQKNKLFFDDLDIFIIRKISDSYKNNEDVNTWEMAKEFISKIFQKNISIIYSTKKIEVDNAYRNIKVRIKKYLEFGFIKKSSGDEGDIFELDLDRILMGRHKFSDGFKECIILRISPINN